MLTANNSVTIDGAAGTVLPGDTEETPGPGWRDLTLNAGGLSQVFSITPGSLNSVAITIRDLSLTGGSLAA